MKKISGHLLGIDQGDIQIFADFETGGPMWVSEGSRERRAKVRFAEPFREPPIVHVSFSLLDMSTGPSIRADISSENVTRQGFDLMFRTWADSRVARINASWIAFGKIGDPDGWDDLL